MQRWVSAAQSDPAGCATEGLEAGEDPVDRETLRGRPHNGWIDCVHRVAPGAAVVAPAETDEVGRQTGLRTLALDRRPEDLDHRVGTDAFPTARRGCEQRGHAARALDW